jgi:hypothetical protein
MAKKTKALTEAAEWVQELMDLIDRADHFNKRTREAAIRLLRAGCAYTVYDGCPHWDENIIAYPGLDTGEALLALSNELAGYDHRHTLENIYREFGSDQRDQ